MQSHLYSIIKIKLTDTGRRDLVIVSCVPGWIRAGMADKSQGSSVWQFASDTKTTKEFTNWFKNKIVIWREKEKKKKILWNQLYRSVAQALPSSYVTLKY